MFSTYGLPKAPYSTSGFVAQMSATTPDVSYAYYSLNGHFWQDEVPFDVEHDCWSQTIVVSQTVGGALIHYCHRCVCGRYADFSTPAVPAQADWSTDLPVTTR